MVNLNLPNKTLYLTISLFLILSITGAAIAYTNAIPNPGHGGDTVWITSPDGEEMTLQTAIDTGLFSSVVSGDGLGGRKVKEIEFTSGSSGGTTCVITIDNIVRCSGRNDYSQLGIGDVSNRADYMAVGGGTGLSNVKNISGTRLNFCALLNDGTVQCWGYNGYGQLGDGTLINRKVPTSVLDEASGSELTGVKSLEQKDNTYAYEFICALLNDNTVKCWGYNGYGQLGVGDTTTRKKAAVVTGITNAKEVKLGGHSSSGFACALLTDGTVKCWGYNGYGQLGDGTKTTQNTPVQVSGLTNVQSIYLASDGYGFACALLTDGTVKCWGYNGYGQLGDGTKTLSSVPVTVQNIGGTYPKATKLQITGTGSYGSVCALLEGGTVKCWGYNGYGRLGVGDSTARTVPTQITNLNNIADLRGTAYSNAGYYCAINTVGNAFCWGYNGYGQLGDGTKTTQNTPVQVSGLNNIKSIEMGGQGSAQYTCAITTNDDLYCWGYNGYGGLGTGDKIGPQLPTKIN